MDVIGAESLQGGPCLVQATACPDGDEDPTSPELFVVILGFVLGDAQSRDGTEQAARGRARSRAPDDAGQRAAGDGGADPRKDSRQDPEAPPAADPEPGGRAHAGALACLRSFVANLRQGRKSRIVTNVGQDRGIMLTAIGNVARQMLPS